MTNVNVIHIHSRKPKTRTQARCRSNTREQQQENPICREEEEGDAIYDTESSLGRCTAVSSRLHFAIGLGLPSRIGMIKQGFLGWFFPLEYRYICIYIYIIIELRALAYQRSCIHPVQTQLINASVGTPLSVQPTTCLERDKDTQRDTKKYRQRSESQRQTQTERQTQRQTGHRQIHTQTDRHRDRQTDKERESSSGVLLSSA